MKIKTLFGLGRRQRKLEETKRYLLEMTEGIYFYGYPVSDCLDRGVISELRREKVGDFALQMGTLVLYALCGHQDAPMQLHWKKVEGNEGVAYHVWVEFEHDGWNWMYRLDGRRDQESDSQIDKSSLFRADYVTLSQGYTSWEWWDIPRVSRHAVENCTDPERSQIAPGLYYQERSVSSSDFRELVNTSMQSMLADRS